MSNSKNYIRYFAILLLTVAISCTSTEKVTKEDEESQQETTNEITESGGKQLQEQLMLTRSKLSDIYLTQQHDIPDSFLKSDTTSNRTNNPFDGYRIQILSSKDVNLADSVSIQFRMWADTTFSDYVPKAYVFFKQPYYKVHVGDFQNRQKANALSQIIKKHYPDAWVVHDRIDPKFTPSDTTSIRLR